MGMASLASGDGYSCWGYYYSVICYWLMGGMGWLATIHWYRCGNGLMAMGCWPTFPWHIGFNWVGTEMLLHYCG